MVEYNDRNNPLLRVEQFDYSRQIFKTVERYSIVHSYGLFRRMTGVGARPEVLSVPCVIAHCTG